MQKLSRELKNTLQNTSQVLNPVNSQLNKDESLSVVSKVLIDNNSEVNQVQHTGRSIKAFVYVKGSNGKVLMPCSFAKAKRMVKAGKAKLIKCYPFKVIQLNFECEGKTQEVKLGIDSGYKNIGFSAVAGSKEVLSGTLVLDSKTSERLTERAMYRRNRRSRHHWYRAARFNNRGKEGFLPPSVKRRIDQHIALICRIYNLLPISKLNVETASFDVQKINNPEIQRKEYQKGNLKDYLNVKNYLFTRESGKCQFCGKEVAGSKTNIHHIKQRKDGGTDKPDNLALLHEECHKKVHSHNWGIFPNTRFFKAETFMGILRKRLKLGLPFMNETFGYITSFKRNEYGISKSHSSDAFVIAEGTVESRSQDINLKQRHRNNRVLQLNRKGFKPAIKKKRSFISPGDFFWIEKKRLVNRGLSCKGKCITIKEKGKIKSIGVKNMIQYFNFGNLIQDIKH